MSTKAQEPAYVAATLRWCNKRRAEKGEKPLKRLPKGMRHNPYSCPCGKAAHLAVGTQTWCPLDYSGPDKPLPKSVQRFVVAFDTGELPQYEETAK